MSDEEEDWTDAVYEAQDKWLSEHYPGRKVNMGWSVDDVTGQVATKVYGEGVLTTDKNLKHTFEEM